MATIGDLYFAFHGSDDQLQLDATKAGASAGAKAGGTFSGAFGNIVKTAAGAVIGAGIGLALKAITQGAVELDAATRKYAADTGATVEETKLAGTQIAALFQTNVDSYATIGDVLSKLRTDLHITGAEAQGVAQDFLHYALATGQDAASATDSLTTAIKAWQIPADQIPGLMDQIVKGHQLYGGSVTDNVAALAKLAPALTAAGFTVDAATGLLNLFAASGLDASKASVAFQTALTKVKSPEQLDALIAKIQSTPDDFDRAKLAVALFGTRAGAQLAEALAPGSKSLADYTVTAQDSVGATDAAAAAIDQGFGNQVVLAFHNVEGSLSGLATNIGPMVDVLDALGNMGINVLPMLGASLGALGPKIIPMLRGLVPIFFAAGAEQGAAIGGATIATETPLVTAGQAAVAAAATPAAITGGTTIGAALGAAIGSAVTLAAITAAVALPVVILAAIRDALPHGGGGTPEGGGQSYLPIGSGPGQWNLFGGVAPAATKAGVQSASDIQDGLERGLTNLGPVVAGTFDHTFDHIRTTALDVATLVVAGLQAITDKFATTTSLDAKIASDAILGIFGAQDRAAALAATNRQIADDKIILSSKKSTAAQKADAAARLLADTQAAEGQEIEMALHGELTKKAYAALIATLTAQAKSGNAEVSANAQLILDKLKLISIQAAKTASDLKGVKVYPTGGGKGPGVNAAGGPLMAGDVSWVGEQGPELRVFAQPSYILTHQEALAIAAGKFGAPGQGGGSGAPLVGTQHVYGIQPDELERQMTRVIRRQHLQLSLAGRG